ncbi:Spy/CpxP family protein refolding chaperone [Photobacterium sp. SDRW27]|uniref:Spy/CpxP family protein refolding chaperone n=1 Tax=Photobacterium obscurum TaxID=2829490 RepID=UPI0022431FA8|nr:Spy/CpxP family protein refolding chaperone [Photobacterium obscurum]MCW8328608.1 Spy/CpxP family protein refolding chaperone [Photobacterium obscurum]
MKSRKKLTTTMTLPLALLATLAYAETDWQGGIMGMMGGPGMMYGGCMMGTTPSQRHHGMMHGRGAAGGGWNISGMQTQLQTLESQLQLNKQQQTQWDKFVTVVENNATAMLEHHQQMFTYFQNNQSLTLPARLEHHTKMMGERYASMTGYTTALLKLYQSLKPHQRKILDQSMFMGCF